MSRRLLRRILFATDFSPSAARAQAYATYFATMWEATVDVLHVIEGPRLSHTSAGGIQLVGDVKEAARQLDEVRDHMTRSGITSSAQYLMGIPHKVIDRVVRENAVDLVVLGIQGRETFLHGLIGSTTERVIKQCPCPVLVVPVQRDEMMTEVTEAKRCIAVRHILVPVDSSSPSLDSFEYAVQLTNGLEATISLVHVLEPVYYDLDYGLGSIEDEELKQDHWKKLLVELSDLVRSLGRAADFRIPAGVPSDGILSSALRSRSDLIVMGTDGRCTSSRLQFGSVAEAVLRLATCPVLIVKAPKFAPGQRRLVPRPMVGV